VIDVFRVVACLLMLFVASTIVLHMKARLNDRKSLLLQFYVFGMSLSAFLGTASRIGTDEPLVWYGAPMRAVVSLIGLAYIIATRHDVKEFRSAR
jgi:hypothetical protein